MAIWTSIILRSGRSKCPGALEAEEGTVTDANVSSAVLGFSGAGYVVFEATGSVAVTVEKVNSGQLSP